MAASGSSLMLPLGALTVGGIMLTSGIKNRRVVDVATFTPDAPTIPGASPNVGGGGPPSAVPGTTPSDTITPVPGQRNGYRFPFGSQFGWGRTDQGVDFTGAGPIGAIGDATVVRVSPQGSGTGWPGAAGKGTGASIVYRLDKAPPIKGASRYVYLNENIDPVHGLHEGMRVRAGQVIAHARGAYPYLETGFASDAHGTPITPYNSSDYEQATPGGGLFRRFLNWLQPIKYQGAH